MVNTPKRAGDGVIIENPDKRTISQGNKELRKEERPDSGRKATAPKPVKPDTEKQAQKWR
ncbi:MAG: hypothetical protein WAU86_11735 [Oricola sp.]